ncbi:MAG: PEGA domain-containing protein [Bacteroidales bacterium]|nr:PEGA domain-containing protein [Bacteroidales bacterium]
MKHLLIILLAAFSFQSLSAQEFDIREFKAEPSDLAARRNQMLTVNGEPCALIKVTTNIKGMQFDSNIGIVDVTHQTDGYWVYIAPRERRVKLMADGFISLDVDMPEPAKSLSVYHLVVAPKGVYHTSDLVRLTFRMNQSNVYVQSGESAPVLSLSNNAVFNVPKGERTFRFIKDGFFEEVKTLNIEKEEVIDITLRAGASSTKLALSGHIIVTSEPSGAEVYLNEQRVGSTNYQNRHLAGKYTLRLQHPNYYEHVEQFELKEGATVEIPKVNLKPRFGYWQVTSNPSGAEVLLNGRSVGVTPIKKQVIQSGFHEVAVRKTNYHEHKETFKLSDGDEKTLNIKLNGAFGDLQITSEPSDARVFIDNKEVGKTPYRNPEMPSGTYNLRVSKELFADANEVITIVDGKKSERYIALTKNYGTLKISSQGSQISINGKTVASNSYAANLAPGEYRVKATKNKHRDDERTAFIMLGQTQEITLTPKPREGAVSVTTTPFETRGAKIYIDGIKHKQTTPATIPLLIGNYNITIKKTGYIDVSQKLIISEGKEELINLRLVSYQGSLIQKVNRYKTAKILYGTAAVASLGTGTYYLLSANNLNEQYKTATTDAGLIYDKMERHDLYSMIAYGAAVPFTVMTIIKATQQNRAEKKVNMALIPLRDGFVFGMAFSF